MSLSPSSEDSGGSKSPLRTNNGHTPYAPTHGRALYASQWEHPHRVSTEVNFQSGNINGRFPQDRTPEQQPDMTDHNADKTMPKTRRTTHSQCQAHRIITEVNGTQRTTSRQRCQDLTPGCMTCTTCTTNSVTVPSPHAPDCAVHSNAYTLQHDTGTNDIPDTVDMRHAVQTCPRDHAQIGTQYRYHTPPDHDRAAQRHVAWTADTPRSLCFERPTRPARPAALPYMDMYHPERST